MRAKWFNSHSQFYLGGAGAGAGAAQRRALSVSVRLPRTDKAVLDSMQKLYLKATHDLSIE